MTENIKHMATEKAKGDLKLSYAYLDEKVAGSWQIKDGKLYKGVPKSMIMIHWLTN
ncbi:MULTISPECIES: hypothetical protein [unclassified Bacillus (in: firmicutes)]|uniref:hypothetical protein n=1 Tax=unclassified Bacillus (in: firmicutes) TaxID=185979 RepID=UPI001CB8FFB1|nr:MULTISPECIES: hypothetical protein [unclassified Bacillus (in: firmicutes)]